MRLVRNTHYFLIKNLPVNLRIAGAILSILVTISAFGIFGYIAVFFAFEKLDDIVHKIVFLFMTITISVNFGISMIIGLVTFFYGKP